MNSPVRKGRGNKPACLYTGFEPPAHQRVVESSLEAALPTPSTEAFVMTAVKSEAQLALDFHLSLILEGHLCEMRLYSDLLLQTSQDLPVDQPGAKVIHALHGALRDRVAQCQAEYEALYRQTQESAA